MRELVIVVLLPVVLAGCSREEPAPSIAGTLSEPASPSPPAPMPRPYRGRVEAAVALNDTCESCHVDEADDWRASRHRQSNTNAAYRAAFAIEPSAFCRGCHAPEAHPTEPPSRAVSEMGVACVTCHVTEDGFVLAAARVGEPASDVSPHPSRRSAELSRTGGCAGCHEFRFPTARGDADRDFMQTTVREHQRLLSQGRTCVDCHMPLREGRRSHAFADVRDPAFLRDHLHVTAELTDDGRIHVSLTQPEPGHAFPTGDLFRRLEVGCEILHEGGSVVAKDVRYLTRHLHLLPGTTERQLVRDDRVFEGPTGVDLSPSWEPGPSPSYVSWWVSYQRVAIVGTGTRPEEAKIESEIMLHEGVLPWKPR